MQDRLLTPEKVADILGTTTRGLEGWRSRRSDGPPFVRLSRRCVRYSEAALRQWIAERAATSTSAETEAA